MKKTVFLLIYLIMQISFCASAFCESVRHFDFMGSSFHLYKIDSRHPNYDMVNRFFAESLEYSSERCELVLFYSRLSMPNEKWFSEFEKDYSKTYTIGTVLRDGNGFSISFMGMEKRYGCVYSIVKFKNNNIAGLDVAQLYMPVSNPDNQKQDELIKKLDKKYFKYFNSYTFLPVVDEYGKEVPRWKLIPKNSKKRLLLSKLQYPPAFLQKSWAKNFLHSASITTKEKQTYVFGLYALDKHCLLCSVN